MADAVAVTDLTGASWSGTTPPPVRDPADGARRHRRLFESTSSAAPSARCPDGPHDGAWPAAWPIARSDARSARARRRRGPARIDGPDGGPVERHQRPTRAAHAGRPLATATGDGPDRQRGRWRGERSRSLMASDRRETSGAIARPTAGIAGEILAVQRHRRAGAVAATSSAVSISGRIRRRSRRVAPVGRVISGPVDCLPLTPVMRRELLEGRHPVPASSSDSTATTSCSASSALGWDRDDPADPVRCRHPARRRPHRPRSRERPPRRGDRPARNERERDRPTTAQRSTS